jgi:hypothetical protein
MISRRERDDGQTHLTPEFLAMVRQPGPQFMRAIEDHLNAAEGSLQPSDDMTLVVVERLAE